MDTSPRDQMNGVRYHDYLAILCSFDDSESIRTGRCLDRDSNVPPHQHVENNFTKVCREYRVRVEANSQLAYGSNGSHPHLAHFLFNPACLVAFGHNDNLGIVLVDDIDPLMAITADCDSRLENTTLAFCPRLESLHLTPGTVFCEPHDLFDGPLSPVDEQGEYPASRHSFEKERPLVVLTKYKIGGLALLARGGIVQEAIFKAMATRIVDTLELLRDEIRSGASSVCSLMSEQDIDAVRCTFLDLQGPEELATFATCTNYSVAIALVTALRTLTFADLSPTMTERLRACDFYSVVLPVITDHINKDLAKAKKPTHSFSNSVDDLQDNHVFCKTYSTLGTSYAAMLNSGKDISPNSYVQAITDLDVAPGHLTEIADKLVAARAHDDNSNVVTNAVRLGASHRFLVGRHDYSFINVQAADMPVITTIDFLGRLKHMTTQGQRSLKGCPGKYFQHELLAPAAGTTLSHDAVLARMLF